jgi:hypothetical protein
MKTKNLTFGEAVEIARVHSLRIYRDGWNGKGMFVFHVPPNTWDFECVDVPGVEDYETDGFLCMKTANDKLIPWLASQADILAYDWNVIPFSDDN